MDSIKQEQARKDVRRIANDVRYMAARGHNYNECLARELIFEIVRRAENCDEKVYYLLEEIKFFQKQFIKSADTVEFAGIKFESKEDSKEFYEGIVARAISPCLNAYCYAWPYTSWYVLTCILKLFNVKPHPELTDFINMFLFTKIEFEESKDAGADDDIGAEDFMKKLRLISLLGKPSLSLKAENRKRDTMTEYFF